MGPDDFLAMSAGYELKRKEDERELYPLRHIAYFVHNALSKPGGQLEHPVQLMHLSGDEDIEHRRKRRIEEQKEQSDELFAKARARGELDKDNQLIKG